jgi:hypothetical protein
MKSIYLATSKRQSKTPIDMDEEDRYDPVPFDPRKRREEMRKKSPEYRAADDALDQEFAALDIQLAGRASNNLSPMDVSDRVLQLFDCSSFKTSIGFENSVAKNNEDVMDERFKEAMEYVLHKYAPLLQRLADYDKTEP